MSDEEWERQKARMAMAKEGEIKSFARFIGLEHNLQVSEWLLRLDERVRKLEGHEAPTAWIEWGEIQTNMPNLLEHVICISHHGDRCEICGKVMGRPAATKMPMPIKDCPYCGNKPSMDACGWWSCPNANCPASVIRASGESWNTRAKGEAGMTGIRDAAFKK